MNKNNTQKLIKNNFLAIITKAENPDMSNIDVYDINSFELVSHTCTYDEFIESSLELMIDELEIKHTDEYKVLKAA